ncbi:WAT1-related protein At1g44800 isoform X2 [Arachis ipaensis]|uniref:WAT1-related protein At1g44800 isoform X2 n=1 Tax=Arachis ipaensis TaxID=130454 RepID=UPI000A2AF733|nr:WAT1-related protein At1g44800 isoform X2 [Arachis ipaensis]XP_025683155.1 WAT1-related protein At1g44800 isoform X2 [Arachis hypogaea]
MEEQNGMGKLLKKLKPYLAMVSLQFGYSGMYVITMVSFKHGMSHWVLSVYRHVIATLIMLPFAFVLERKIRPKMTLPIFLRLAALGFLEPVLDQNLYNMGMKSTSTTFASAIVNVLPAITFVMALIFRLETVNLRKIHSVAKVIGTMVTVSGAMIMTLYKGPALEFIKGHGGGAIHHDSRNGSRTEPSEQNWVIGTLMLIASCGGWASFFILQGVVCSGIAYYVQGVVTRERGPVFVTSFSPLIMIITAALGTIVLAEQIHLGSVIGAIVIVCGLYTVVWGKSKDNVNNTEAVKVEGQELPIRDSTKSGSNIFENIDVNVPSEIK